MIRKHILFIGLLGALAMLLVACNGSGGVTPVRQVGTMTGHVIDVALDQPLAGVTVHIKSIPFATDMSETGIFDMTTVTDQNGTFYRVDVPVGEVRIYVSKDGFKTPGYKVWVLYAGGIGQTDFDMAPGIDPAGEFGGDEMSAWPPAHGGGK